MKKIVTNTMLIAVSIWFSGCSWIIGHKVEVPPAHVGKILTKQGFKKDLIPPSKFRLETCFAYCDRLITMEVSDQPVKETFANLFMPKDQLTMDFDIRLTLSINTDKVNTVYARVPAEMGKISFQRVYLTYAKPIIRDEVRQVLAEFSINEVASSREKLSAKLELVVRNALKDTPISLKRLGLAEVKFPDVITTAKTQAAERREQIEQEKAQFEIQKVQLERKLESAKMSRAIEREKATGVAEVNELLAKSVNDKYLAYKQLEVLELMATSENKVFVPVEALGSLGMQHAVFNSEVKRANKKSN